MRKYSRLKKAIGYDDRVRHIETNEVGYVTMCDAWQDSVSVVWNRGSDDEYEQDEVPVNKLKLAKNIKKTRKASVALSVGDYVSIGGFAGNNSYAQIMDIFGDEIFVQDENGYTNTFPISKVISESDPGNYGIGCVRKLERPQSIEWAQKALAFDADNAFIDLQEREDGLNNFMRQHY